MKTTIFYSALICCGLMSGAANALNVSNVSITNLSVNRKNQLSFTFQYTASMRGCRLDGGNQAEVALTITPLSPGPGNCSITSNASCDVLSGARLVTHIFFPHGYGTLTDSWSAIVTGLPYMPQGSPTSLKYSTYDTCSQYIDNNGIVPLPPLPAVKTCSVGSDPVPVDLGRWSLSDFNQVGTTTTNKDVSFTIDCDEGGTKVTATPSATKDTSSGISNVIALTKGADSATGVGIQLMDQNGAVLKINKANVAINSAVKGANTIHWLAHYIQTQDQVTEGTGNAVVTVTLAYQ